MFFLCLVQYHDMHLHFSIRLHSIMLNHTESFRLRTPLCINIRAQSEVAQEVSSELYSR
jgi:hypothetical protein